MTDAMSAQAIAGIRLVKETPVSLARATSIGPSNPAAPQSHLLTTASGVTYAMPAPVPPDQALSQIEPGNAEKGRGEPGEHVARPPEGDPRHCNPPWALPVRPKSADDHTYRRQGKIRDCVSPRRRRQVLAEADDERLGKDRP